jgi:hypothetical protein
VYEIVKQRLRARKATKKADTPAHHHTVEPLPGIHW